MQLVGFTLGGDLFGVDINQVREILRPLPVLSLPNAPPWIEGVINLRTSVMPVIDLRKRLNLFDPSMQNNKTMMMVLDIHDTQSCFIVNTVTGIHSAGELTRTGGAGSEQDAEANRYVRGLCDIGDIRLKVLDFTRLLGADELLEMKSLKSVGRG